MLKSKGAGRPKVPRCKGCIRIEKRLWKARKRVEQPERFRAARARRRHKAREELRRWRLANPFKEAAIQWRRRKGQVGELRYEEVRAYVRKQKWAKNYGMTPEQYLELHAAQGGLCAICKRPESDRRDGSLKLLAVDHNHVTGGRRGLLCRKCNVALGFLMEDREILTSAIKYLEAHAP